MAPQGLQVQSPHNTPAIWLSVTQLPCGACKPLCLSGQNSCLLPFLQGLEVKVWRDYEEFLEELSSKFPHEKEGIRKFYDECWRVFNSLNSLELKSLEEPRYLLGGGLSAVLLGPLACCGKLTRSPDVMAGRYVPKQVLLCPYRLP